MQNSLLDIFDEIWPMTLYQEYIIYKESIERPYRSCCMSACLLKVTFRILQYTLSMNIIIKRHVGCSWQSLGAQTHGY